MKNKIFFKTLFGVSIILGINLFFGCSSFQKKNKTDSKEVTVASGICNLIVERKYEAAFARMDESFKVVHSLDDFSSAVKRNFDGCNKILKLKSKIIEENQNYLSFVCEMKTDSGKKECNFIFSKGTLLPLDIRFSDEINQKKSAESKNKSGKKNNQKSIEIENEENSQNKNFVQKIGEFNLSKAMEQESLKDLCENYFKLGFGIYGYNSETNAVNFPEYMEVAQKHFNSCTLTNLMKSAYILDEKKSRENLKNGNEEPALDFKIIEKTLEWCQKNNVQMRGHTLVWHTQSPRWFFCEDYDASKNYVSREKMILRLDSFIKQYLSYVQENFPGVVYCWDVVNEAVDPVAGDETTDFMCRSENDGTENYWYYTIGNDYPEVAFTIARKYAADGVKLFYNDYGAIDRKKSGYIYNLCKNLAEKGLIDGIGMQGYWDVKNPSLKEIKAAIDLYSSIGLELQLTEWSIPARENSEKGFDEQGERYASVLRLLKNLDSDGGGKANITAITFFGLMDGYTLYGNDKTNSRLFDKNLEPKSAFYKIRDTFNVWY